MRISSRAAIDQALRNFTTAQERLAELQQRLATGKRVSKPSDDPADVTRALAIRTDIKLGEQYVRNIASGNARLGATEATLGSLTEIVQRARELAITGANDTLDQGQRNQIAAEVSGLLDEAISAGNMQFAGQYMFAGHQTTTAPFTPVGVPPSSVTYNGDSGKIERVISVGSRVQVNVAGDTAFGPTHSALIALRDNLLTGNVQAVRTTDLTALDGALDGILEIRGQLGATTNRLEMTRQRIEDATISQKVQLSEIEDADLVGTIVDLNAQQAVFEAALATTARSIQLTLVDFLR